MENLGRGLQAGALFRIDIEAQCLGELAAQSCAQDTGAGVGLGQFAGSCDGRLRCALDLFGRCKKYGFEYPRLGAVSDPAHGRGNCRFDS